MQRPEVMKIKICLVGDGAVGKTSLISRYIYNQFDDKYLLTLGTKTSLKKISMKLDDGRSLDLNMSIWDIMGQKEFERLHKTFFRGAQGAIIVTDVTRKETLTSVEEWMLRLISVVGEIPMIFVANKMDLIDQSQFKPVELQVFANRYHSKVYQCSAKTGQNVEEFFFDIGKAIAQKATGAKVLPPEKTEATAAADATAPATELVELLPLGEEAATQAAPAQAPAPSSPAPATSSAPQNGSAPATTNAPQNGTSPAPATSSAQASPNHEPAPATSPAQTSPNHEPVPASQITSPSPAPMATHAPQNGTSPAPATSPAPQNGSAPATTNAPQNGTNPAQVGTPAPQTVPSSPGAPPKDRPRPPKPPPPPEALHKESEELKEMRVSITNLNRTTQQLQQQISALQKEITELRALQTEKSGPACPQCHQPATYIAQYKQYYCYKCKDYL